MNNAPYCYVLHALPRQVDYRSVFDNRHIKYKSTPGADGQRQWTVQEVNP